MGLSNPTYTVRLFFHLGFLVVTFFAFEGIDWAKIMRKTHYRQGILIHTLVCIAVSYLVAEFFLTIIFKAYI